MCRIFFTVDSFPAVCDLSTPREASGRTLGTFTSRDLECFRLVRVVTNTLSRKEPDSWPALLDCVPWVMVDGDGQVHSC